MHKLINRIRERSLLEGFTQECAVAFAEGWFETLVDIDIEKSFTVKEIFELMICLDETRKCSGVTAKRGVE